MAVNLSPVEWIVMLADDGLFSAIAAVAFAMLFNVPRRILPYVALLGALGHSFRTVLMMYGLGIEIGTLFAATLIGSLGMYYSPRHLMPVQAYTVAAIIPMIPGKFAFTTVVGLVHMTVDNDVSAELMTNVVVNALKTVFILGALTVGLAIPRMLFGRSKPVV